MDYTQVECCKIDWSPFLIYKHEKSSKIKLFINLQPGKYIDKNESFKNFKVKIKTNKKQNIKNKRNQNPCYYIKLVQLKKKFFFFLKLLLY